MNFAGVQKLPVVFVVTNNQWAISVPLRLQTASETLAQKAIAAGFIGEQVDGNDIVAMHAAAEEAIEAARNGRGPRFIEAVTYRLGDHTTADDAARYRPTEEVQARWKEEPIARLRSFLAGQSAWSKTDEEQLSGSERVFDTPLAELLISGLCVGMAAQGLKPVGEIQFMGFIYPCIDQLVNHASRLRNRTQGRLSCPMVLRTPHGGGIRAPEHHSESTEAMLAHIPGLRVVIPSSPERAYGLLLAAIRDPDPVVFLEPTRIYRAARGEVEDNGEALPLDVAFILREGRDVTLISWGAMVKETLAAAEALDAEGISAEVIDLATLKPYDEETLLSSVEKTGRCIIVHEAARTGGFGAEIAALIAERGLTSLLAPVARVTGYDTVMPLPRLEQHYMPSVDRIATAGRKACQFS